MDDITADIVRTYIPDVLDNVDITHPPTDVLIHHPWNHIEWLERFVIDTKDEPWSYVIPTQSSYIIDHVHNLITGSKFPYENAKLLRFKNERAFLPRDIVTVHKYKNGKLVNAISKKGYINWNVLSKPANWLCGIYFRMKVDDD